ncbi:U4/U6.U5 tri-snRNP-associated protein 1-like isoform X2 [Cryptotermes secundus]|uniref:U4/U6.U5 tri-snRNP-associated protein 1-like isoform X2 n=1 Tax=Cryptotermes secundus TaxID=105785 RepID=UPI000CD7B093|nr:U4/U6.U5 tri-snRNP-associated protein 1-like isoform X2 [Cryptotermes secundus]
MQAERDDEKFGCRERYGGPTSDFTVKEGYKQNVKLDYIDDDGHVLNAKEAFRYVSHEFHGKGPGKNKVEKQRKKTEQEGLMKQMSSTDTHLERLASCSRSRKKCSLHSWSLVAVNKHEATI